MTLYDRVVSPLDARPELISCATENEIFDMICWLETMGHRVNWR